MQINVIHVQAFADDTAAYIADQIQSSIARQGYCVIGLCGGTTPRGVYRRLAEGWAKKLDWTKIYITWGDERMVAPNHPDSNYKMVKEAMLEQLPHLPSTNILRIQGELSAPIAAKTYEQDLRNLAQQLGVQTLCHDIMLLGLGADGHTASLFPGTAALKEQQAWVVANHVPQLDCYRITMTYPLINASSKIVFLVKKDPAKEKVIAQVQANAPQHPASHVRAIQELVWMIGEDK